MGVSKVLKALVGGGKPKTAEADAAPPAQSNDSTATQTVFTPPGLENERPELGRKKLLGT